MVGGFVGVVGVGGGVGFVEAQAADHLVDGHALDAGGAGGGGDVVVVGLEEGFEVLAVEFVDQALLGDLEGDVDVDVAELAVFFGGRFEAQGRVVGEQDGALVRHGWPGNLRELRNAVERIVLLAGGDEVGVADLPAEVGGEGPEIDDLYRPFRSLDEGVRAFQLYFLRRLLRESRGDVAVAAKRAGISTEELRKALG